LTGVFFEAKLSATILFRKKLLVVFNLGKLALKLNPLAPSKHIRFGLAQTLPDLHPPELDSWGF
jgi:hypothetical protein